MVENSQLPLITIIVPIYKVENYLDKCVYSIIQQTYTNLEIILVDDGSPDNCGNICENYRKKDLRIKVIHKENGGLSDARNVGINSATGEYIAFIDSDDYIAINYIEELYKAIKKYNVQIALCSYILISESGENIRIEKVTTEEKCINNKQLLNEVMTPYGEKYVVVWNKLYKKSLFNSLRFPKGKLYEDEYINFKLFWQCTNVVLVPSILYFYLQRNDSIQGSKLTLEKLNMKREFHLERIAFYSKLKEKQLYMRSIQMYCNWITSCFANSYELLDKKYKIMLQKEIRKYAFISFKSNESKMGEKIQNILGFFSLKLAGKIKKYYKKSEIGDKNGK